MLLEAFPEGAYHRSSFGQRPLLYVFGHDILPADYSARTTEDFPADENSAEENSAETPVRRHCISQGARTVMRIWLHSRQFDSVFAGPNPSIVPEAAFNA